MADPEPTFDTHETGHGSSGRWWLFAVALYLSAVVLVCALGWRKYRALAFHSRDYAYYLQFAARLSDPTLSNRFAVSPFGHSMLGFADIDGRGSLHRGIHFEPLKYLQAVVYAVAPSPMALILVGALLFYLPLLYVFRAMPRGDPSQRRFLVLLALCWAFCPAGIMSALRDLRPIVILAPALFVLVVAILYDRPRWEVLVAAVCLLAVREEGLVLVACCGVMLAGRNVARSRSVWHGLPSLAVAWCCFALLVAVYYRWAGFARAPQPRSLGGNLWALRLVPPAVWFALLATVACVAGLLRWRWGEQARRVLGLLSFLPIVAVLAFHLPSMVRNVHANWSFLAILVGREWSLYATIILMFPVVLRRMVATPKMRGVSETVLWACLLLFATLNLVADRGFLGRWCEWSARMAEAEPVFRAREEMDCHTTRVMTGYAAYQAFAGFEHAVCYERVPTWRLPDGPVEIIGQVWGFPVNRALVRRIFRDETQWLVLTPVERQELRKVLERSGVPWDVVHVGGNDAFEIYRRRPERGDR